jgi:hypothetical protein
MAKPTIADRLSAARGEFDATNRQRMELEAKRNAALIADDDRTATKLAGQLDELRLLARGHEDKIKLLEAAAEEEANARRVKEKAALIGRIEARLAERNKVAAELAEMLPQANNLFRRLLELNRAIDSSWPWPGSDRLSIMLPRESIAAAISHELFRVSAVPWRGGGLDEGNPVAGLRFPGSKSSHLGLLELPEAVTPLVDVLRSASEHASNIMRGKAVPVTASAALASNGSAQRTPAEGRLAGLLQRQAELAALTAPTPSDDAEYAETVQQIVLAQTAIETEKANA